MADKPQRLMSLLTAAHTDCSSWMCFVGAWGCSAASKAERAILQHSYFIRLVPKFPNSHNWEQAESHNFLQIYRRDFPIPPWCLEHVCILPQGIPTSSVECVECSQPPVTLGRAEFLGVQLLLQLQKS